MNFDCAYLLCPYGQATRIAAGAGRACMMWCAAKLPQKDALKSVHSRHTEKCALHAIADEALFILGVVCRGSIGWQRPEDAKPSCSILRLKHWLRHHVCAVYAQLPKEKKRGGGTHCDMMKLCRSVPVNVLRVRRREGESV